MIRVGSLCLHTIITMMARQQHWRHWRSALGPSMRCIGACAVLLMCSVGCERAPAPKPPTPIVPSARNPRSPQGSEAPPVGSVGGSVRVSSATSDPKLIEIGGLVMPKPVTWQWQAPTVQFRALQYAVPTKAEGASDAELVFSVFAAGDGGPMDANVKRWISQFRAEDGSAAEAIISDSTVNGIAVKTIELAGLYQGMGQAAPRPGIRQLGAILRTAQGTVFIRLVGPDATVESWRRDFDAMIAGVRPQS